MEENFDLRIKLGAASNVEDFKKVTSELKDKYIDYHEGRNVWIQNVECESTDLVLPPWLCQPYVRMPPEQHLKLVESKVKAAEDNSQVSFYEFVTISSFIFCSKLEIFTQIYLLYLVGKF